uniref:ATP synthase complex subunit 8 n=1 Tax=Pterygota sp. 3 LC-2017 TaxID=2030424 RepID=A0A2D1CRA5_9INSE|nr:ATP synthase F0 subunit 8 [Pterygota sp. 3 LC-2017]
MPQMSPMLWSLLFIYFILLFLIFNILNYFNFIPMIKILNQQKFFSKKLSMNWKW